MAIARDSRITNAAHVQLLPPPPLLLLQPQARTTNSEHVPNLPASTKTHGWKGCKDACIHFKLELLAPPRHS